MTAMTRCRARRAATTALAALAASVAVAAPAQAEFGLVDATARFHDPGGTTVTQAGSHSDLTVFFQLRSAGVGSNGLSIPDGNLRDLVVDLPDGFYGNPQNVPTCEASDLGDGSLGSCPPESQVGVANLLVGPDPNDPAGYFIPVPVHNIVPAPGEAAVLGFSVFGAIVKMTNTVRADGTYALRTTMQNANQTLPLGGVRLTLWGVPADAAHDAERYDPAIQWYGAPSTAPRRPFLTAPAQCDRAVGVRFRARSWQGSPWSELRAPVGTMTGCDQLPFSGSFSMRPTSGQADAPSGYQASLALDVVEDPDTPGSALLRQAVVQLPEGTAISPSAASGLGACNDGQIRIGSDAPSSCPASSKIGSVSIATPLLPTPLNGDIYLGNPQTGAMFRLFLVAEGHGVRLKIPGGIVADPRTGRLTASFVDTPELPFTGLQLNFKGGERAPLVNPSRCGYHPVTATLQSYAGTSVSSASGFSIDTWDGPGTACPEGTPFAPTLQAGTTSAAPSTESAFVLSVKRPDRHATIDRLDVDLPSGLLGQVSRVPLCGEAEAAAGTCAAESRVGSVGIEAGSGGQPFPLTGDVFLAGPYKGAPFSLAIVVDALAGPFDLGRVVVRAPIRVDAANAKLAIQSDSIPSMLAGIPLRIRTIDITIDRAGFMHSPANCAPLEIKTTVFSGDGRQADLSSPYQADGCAALPFAPRVSFATAGDGGSAGSNLAVRIEQGLGEGHLRSLKVVLPAKLTARLSTAAQACPPEVYASDPGACPPLSLVGRTSATTPALPDPLSGPVHLVLAEGGGLPNLALTLDGQGAAQGVGLKLVGKITFEGGLTTASFDGIPDVPLSSFGLDLAGGKDSALQGRAVCSGNPQVRITALAHHGATHSAAVPLQRSGCSERSAASKTTKAKKAKKAKKSEKARKGRKADRARRARG